MDSSDRAALARALRAIYAEIGAAADRAVARFAPGGRVPTRAGGTGTTQGAEPPLGNPAADGDALVSTAAGVRSWVDVATQAELDAHTGDATAAHAASAIAFTPDGSIAATDVQAAIQEVRDEAHTEIGQYVAGTAPSSPATGAIWLDTATAATDMATQAELDAAVATLQPLDADLTTLAGLTATTDNMIQAVASAWASRTPAQVKAALALDLVSNVKHNWAATADPTVTDDSASGYSVGSLWENTITGLVYACLANAAGVAVWRPISQGAPALIAETTLGGGGGASVTFGSLPQIYRNLYLTWSVLGDTGTTGLALQFDGDTTANYDFERLSAFGTTVQAAESLGNTKLRVGTINAIGMSPGEATILEYTRTDRAKITYSQSSRADGTATGNINVERTAGIWRTTNQAITSITIIPLANGLAAGSVLRLWGLP